MIIYTEKETIYFPYEQKVETILNHFYKNNYNLELIKFEEKKEGIYIKNKCIYKRIFKTTQTYFKRRYSFIDIVIDKVINVAYKNYVSFSSDFLQNEKFYKNYDYLDSKYIKLTDTLISNKSLENEKLTLKQCLYVLEYYIYNSDYGKIINFIEKKEKDCFKDTLIYSTLKKCIIYENFNLFFQLSFNYDNHVDYYLNSLYILYNK